MNDSSQKMKSLSQAQLNRVLERIGSKKKGTTTIPRRDHTEGETGLSLAQQRLWFMWLLDPDNPFYNVPGVLHLTGTLDLRALERSLSGIVRRHEVLRTAFIEEEGRAVQRLVSAGDFRLSFIDFSALPEPDKSKEAERIVQEEASRPFHLGEAPLLRGLVVRMAPEEHLFVVVMHHMVSDGWSLGVFVKELASLYDALKQGNESPLVELPIQYADYAHWQRRKYEAGELQGQLAYWKNKLGRDNASIALPADRRRPPFQRYRGAKYRMLLPASLQQKLEDTARGKNATLFMILLAGLHALLYRYSNQSTIRIGCPVANRKYPEMEDLIGVFMNTLVMRAELSPELSFNELLNQVRTTALEAFEHQDVPFEKLVEELQPERHMSHNPFFQVAFFFQNVPMPPLELADLTIRQNPVDGGTSKFDLTFQFTPRDEGMELEIEYNTDLFDESTVARMSGHWQTLLTAVASNADLHISELPLLSEEELLHFHAWNATSSDYDGPWLLHELFEAQVRRTPDAVALEFEGKRLTYLELEQRSNQLAHHLRGRGIGPERTVGLLLDRSIELVIGILGTLKAGGAYVPIGPDYPPDRIRFMIEDSQVPILLTQSHLLTGLPETGVPVVALDVEWKDKISRESVLPPDAGVRPEHLAYVIYTSGSTGKPKGVMNEHRGICNRMHWMLETFRLEPDDRVIQKTPYTFDVSIWELFWPLITGARLMIARPGGHADSAYLVDFIAKHRITVAHFVPSMLRIFLQERDLSRCASLKQVYCTGEALAPDIAQECMERLGVRLVNLYGPTEAAVEASWWECAKGESEVPIGRPIANMQMYVLDAQGHRVPVGVTGELYIGGVGVARGYWNREELTSERFLPDPYTDQPGARLYRTGDLARFRADGALEFLGRTDYQVKVRGFRIELGEIEAVLGQHKSVRDAVLIAQPDASGSSRLIAYWVREPGATASVSDLREHIRQALPVYMIPSLFIELERIPLLSNGKTDRGSLPSPDAAQWDKDKARTAPRTPLERTLVRIWSELLGTEEIGIEDSFFELGGHSLLAIRLVAQIREVLKVECPLRQLIAAPTIAELSACLDTAAAAGACSGLPEPSGGDAWQPAVPDAEHLYEPFPLNEVQQAYWIGRSADFELGNVGAHLYIEIDASAHSILRLNQALNVLIGRHPMMRAIVRSDGMQQILQEVPPYEVNCRDLRHLHPEEAERELLEIRSELSHRHAPADRYPLFDISATLLANERLRLHFSVDLLIGDAQSWYVMLQELNQLMRDPQATLPPLGLTFRDYVLAERQVLESEAYTRSKAYWAARVSELSPAPELPLARSADSLQAPRFRRLAAFLSPEDWRRLCGYGGRFAVTPSAILLGAFSEVLAVWSKKPRFTINLTLFNRLPIHPDVNRIVGDFTTLTLLEVNYSGQASFGARVKTIQQQLWEDLEHRSYSGIQVLRDYARANLDSSSVAMPVVFTSTLTKTDGLDASVMRGLGEVVYGVSQTPQVYLDHQVYEDAGMLRFHWDVAEDMFPPEMIDDMFTAYCSLLRRLTDEVEAWNEPVGPLAPANQLERIGSVNATETELPRGLLHEPFFEQASLRPEDAAVLAPGMTLTYGELARLADSLADWLIGRGAGPNRPVAVVMEKGWEQAAAVLGILRAHAPYLPIDPGLPTERIRLLLESGEIRFAITQSKVDTAVQWPDGIERYCVDGPKPQADEASKPEAITAASEDDLAYIIYTSGSTGMPKGVAITHGSARNTLEDLRSRLRIGAQDRVLALSSLSFDLSVFDLAGLLLAGGTVVYPSVGGLKDPADWLERMHECQVTVWNSVPALMGLLVDYAAATSRRLPDCLRLIMLSGDWIPVGLPERIREIAAPGVEIVSLGGATEASIWSVLYPIGTVDPAWRSIPYGRPMANQRLYVLDEKLEHRPVWVPGDLYIGGVGLAREYWRDADKTASSFIRHPATGERLYRTGDLARYLPSGDLEFLGREDAQVKIRGYRIELGEIEQALRGHEAVKEALVAVKPGPSGDAAAVGYVLLHSSELNKIDGQRLRSFLSGKLPDYMVPAAVFILEQWPMTANGKLDVKALPAPEMSGQTSGMEARGENVTDRERIMTIVKGSLQIDDLTEDTNLLEIGVTSMDVVRMANALEKAFGLRMKFDEFYRRPTVGDVTQSYVTRMHKHVADAIKMPRPAVERTQMESFAASYEVIVDPEERERFKQRRHWLRSEPYAPAIDLTACDSEEPAAEFVTLEPCRHYAQEPMPFGRLARLLQALRHDDSHGKGVRQHPSFGELYAVQAYLYIHGGRVEGLDEGVYYYDPSKNRLLLLSPEARFSKDIHVPFVYQPVFEQASFSVFLIADLDAIGPMYGDQAERLCTLEAGYMGQLLMSAAAAEGLGLHPVGTIDFASIRGMFKLKDRHVLVHSLLGGVPEARTGRPEEDGDENDWEEGVLE
ncbi:non-ribosomal peptide synthetase [Paenibacillus tyrfis]|uniref:non-ribosomal peptide synthetase n=1 Tax=Paenibacillus tyrfis TaxID=1501230 RepID=UPI00068E74C0|nr:non-ribosomal peptide synthetase [Paenibacillus tyrfis]